MSRRKYREEKNAHSARDLRGDDYYYGGAHSQRQDWGYREFDNNTFDRREGMYQAGGRDFDERLLEAYEKDRNDPGWWASHSPVSGDRPWYERRPHPHSTSFTGGDRGWGERRYERIVGEVRNFSGVGPKGYRKSDERIREDVCESLARHPGVDASDIEVSVKEGHVTLRGTVPNRWMKRQAEDAVEYVPGVEDVRIDLTVFIHGQGKEGDMRAS
jgi:hypothetical protein